jgi:hypothetical protein
MPNTAPTTDEILLRRALGESCGQECVDWAMSTLERGTGGPDIAILATLSPPLNHFEVASIRDRALAEIGAPHLSLPELADRVAAQLLREALDGTLSLIEALEQVKDLAVATDYPKHLYPFYLLYFAHVDLATSEVQWYWPGATRQNISSLTREHAQAFLATWAARA